MGIRLDQPTIGAGCEGFLDLDPRVDSRSAQLWPKTVLVYINRYTILLRPIS